MQYSAKQVNNAFIVFRFNPIKGGGLPIIPKENVGNIDFKPRNSINA